MRWYADDSDLKTITEHNFPNIVLFGGVAVPYDQEKDLREAIEEAKEKYAHRRSPVKWNFKDLEDKYKENGQIEHYKNILENMSNVRKDIFKAASEFDFCIICSLVKGYSSNKKTLKETKPKLARHVFSNSLMRYALHAQEHKAKKPEIILDWPDGNDPKPYDTEYSSAFNAGITKDGTPYTSGALSQLGFVDSPAYARMHHNTLLQFADLVLGATREMIHHSIDENKKPKQGTELLYSVADKFRGYPNNVIGRGISVSPKTTDIKGKIDKKFKKLYVQS